MNINSHSLKLQGKGELPEPIEVGNNYEIRSEGSVVKEELFDNDDGTFSKVYTFKPVIVEIKNDKGKRLKLKDNRKNSQRVRNLLFKEYHKEGYLQDFDEVYDEFSLVVMFHIPELLREAIERLKERGK